MTDEDTIRLLENEMKKLAKIVMQYRNLFMSLLEAKQKVYDVRGLNSPPSYLIETVRIEKEEYNRWLKVQKIINDAAYK